MAVLVWLVFGLVVGLIARAVMPGNQKMGLIMTTLLGVTGSLLGGFVASMLSGETTDRFAGAGLIGSLLGALLLLGIAGVLNRPAVTR